MKFDRKIVLKNGTYNTNIPMNIVKMLGIETQDRLEYTVCKDGKIVINKLKDKEV